MDNLKELNNMNIIFANKIGLVSIRRELNNKKAKEGDPTSKYSYLKTSIEEDEEKELKELINFFKDADDDDKNKLSSRIFLALGRSRQKGSNDVSTIHELSSQPKSPSGRNSSIIQNVVKKKNHFNSQGNVKTATNQARSIFKISVPKESLNFTTPMRPNMKKYSMESKFTNKQCYSQNKSVDSVPRSLITPFNKYVEDQSAMNQTDSSKFRNKSHENRNLPCIQNPIKKEDFLYFSPTKQNEQVAQVLLDIIQNDNKCSRVKSSIMSKTGMKNWFLNDNPNDFAKTQANYVKQIDAYLRSQTSHKRKSYYGKGREEIMKKIEKGYAIDENSLKKAVGRQKNTSFGTTAIYNNYVIKLLSNFNDPYIKSKYDMHLNMIKKKKSQTASNVYKRMNIDVKRRESIIPSDLANLNLPIHKRNNVSIS